METICLHFELPAPAEPMAEPNRTARRLARENRILRRTCAACLAAMFAALAWYAWDGLQTRKTYDLLKTSARQTAQAAIAPPPRPPSSAHRTTAPKLTACNANLTEPTNAPTNTRPKPKTYSASLTR